jgi:hypothetical protein
MQLELRGMGGADRGYQHYSGIFDCLSRVSPVSIAKLGDGRHSLGVMPEGHGNVPHQKARDRDAIVAPHGECAITVLISPHHSSTTGPQWFSSRSLALCIRNRCALQHHLIRNYACDRPRRSMFKIEQTGFFSSARLPGMDKPRLDAPGSPAVGFEHDRLIFARLRTARCVAARVGEPGSSRAG